MDKKFWISAAVMFVVMMILGMAVHGFILGPQYAKLTFMRGEAAAQELFGFMILAHVSMALGFTWIYAKGREVGRPWLGQGVRFGIAVTVLMCIPTYLIYYVVMPYPSDIVAQQIVFDTIGNVIAGIVVAWLYRA